MGDVVPTPDIDLDSEGVLQDLEADWVIDLADGDISEGDITDGDDGLEVNLGGIIGGTISRTNTRRAPTIPYPLLAEAMEAPASACPSTSCQLMPFGPILGTSTKSTSGKFASCPLFPTNQQPWNGEDNSLTQSKWTLPSSQASTPSLSTTPIPPLSPTGVKSEAPTTPSPSSLLGPS